MSENEKAEEPELEVYEGEVFDDPNRQAVGLPPAWEEGTGGDPGPAPEASDAAEGKPDASTADLDDMTKDELLEHARTLGVKPANAAMSKDELRAAVDAKLAEDDEG